MTEQNNSTKKTDDRYTNGVRETINGNMLKINKLVCDSYKIKATITNYIAKGSYFNPKYLQSLPTLK